MSTLALVGTNDAGNPGRAATAARYLDLPLLAVALPVFVAAGWPLLGYGVLAAVWIVQLGIERVAERRAALAMRGGDRRAAMGWIGATTLGRVWLVALTVLVVGLAEREAGLAAALLAAALFTLHLGGKLLARLLDPERAERSD